MSVVTDVWIIVGDIDEPGNRKTAESRVEEVARALKAHLGYLWDVTTISLVRDDWEGLQNGGKVAGSAAIWLGINHARMDDLEAFLKVRGFKHLTIWSHHENKKDRPPRVVSL